MPDEDTSGGDGPSGQPADKKRPRDSPVNADDSAKKPKTSFGPAWSPSLPPTPRPSFGIPALMGTTSSFPFGTGTNFPQPQASPQVNLATPSTASQAWIQIDAQQWEKTNSDVQDLIKEVSELKKRLDGSEEPAASSKATSVRTRPHMGVIFEEEYLAILQQLDLRPPEGIINWMKIVFSFGTLKLIDFGHLELVIVTSGPLNMTPILDESDGDKKRSERGLDSFQRKYRNECINLVTVKEQRDSDNIPTHMLHLGAVYAIHYNDGYVHTPPSFIAYAFMDISKSAKSLWMVTVGDGGIPPSRCDLDLAENGLLCFDIAKIVDDIRTLEASGSDGTIIVNNEQAIQTLKASARLVNGALRFEKPDVLELQEAMRHGWADDEDEASSSKED
ncbi:uncharacterized protein PG986_008471 [Apiospora aurea]|uniref:Uncharacterized protein n=1 Tax=Apiospora aurea TaxID=335848 RepID=A0ABR1QFV4_9PEZI